MSNTGIYYIDGEMVAESGDVVVYGVGSLLYLEIGPGHTLWTLESELPDYIEQLGDTPFGNVLEIGLGLGVASRYILSCEKVKTLTTIEINRDVIKIYNKVKDVLDERLNLPSDKEHRVVNNDGLRYIGHTRCKYDFIFMDHYTLLDEETLPEIENLVRAGKRILNKDGMITGWFDKFTPEEFTAWFNEIFNSNYKTK